MRDIREVSLEKYGVVKQMFNEFFQKLDEAIRLKPDKIEQMLDYWSKGEIVILGKFNGEALLGIVVLGVVTNRLSIVHVRTSQDLDTTQIFAFERELFDGGFEYLRRHKPWVTTVPRWMNANVLEHALEIGFKRYEKIGMVADRESLEAAIVPEVPSGYTLELYDDQWKDAIAMLLYENFRDSDSASAEPHDLYTLDRCQALVNDIEIGGSGDFRNGDYSWVLKHGSEIVGITLRTIPEETTALGAAMCLRQTHRGKGLGKLIFIHSLQYLLKHEPEVNKVMLYVYDTNPAKILYASVGFKETARMSVYTWLKEDKT